MKRFDIEPTQGGGLDIQETSFGDWVRWDDVRKLKESLTELLDVARSLVEADEDDYYSDYREVAKEARKVIAKFEGKK